MTVVRQLGGSREPQARLAPARAAIHPQNRIDYGFFNSEYGFVEPLASHCKQSSGSFLIANHSSVELHSALMLSRFTAHESRVRGSDHEPGSRRVVSTRCRDTNRAPLPETAKRVELLVNRRKHTIAGSSTRDWFYPGFRLFLHPPACATPGSLLPTSHQSPVTTHDSPSSHLLALRDVEGPLATSHCGTHCL